MSKLLEKSKYFKKQADVLLEKTNIVSDLEEFGDIVMSGSYAGDVMMNGDIDITIVRQDPYSAEEVLDILKKLYIKGKFRSYFIGGDWDDPRKGKEFPNGYYIGLKQRLGEEKWKIDIWFISRDEFEDRKGDFIDIANIELTEDQRQLILKCKEYRNKEDLHISGQEIYEAVLNKGVKDVNKISLSKKGF